MDRGYEMRMERIKKREDRDGEYGVDGEMRIGRLIWKAKEELTAITKGLFTHRQ